MSKIREFRIGKGKTTRPGEAEVWDKRYLEFTVELPEKFTEEGLHEALLRAEYIIDNFLEVTEATSARATIPQFNTEELMKHAWKGKKDPDHDGEYLKGSLGWGWDKKEEFSNEVINVLRKGPITIDQYVFTLDGNLVSAKKKKDTAK